MAGRWTRSKNVITVPDPFNGEPFVHVPDTSGDELQPFIDSSKTCPKSGLHNPFRNPERYVVVVVW